MPGMKLPKVWPAIRLHIPAAKQNFWCCAVSQPEKVGAVIALAILLPVADWVMMDYSCLETHQAATVDLRQNRCLC